MTAARDAAADSAFEIRNLKFVSAFTLVEMILAIGVVALVLIAVNAVLFTALRLREVTTNVVDAATPVDQAFTFLRRDLECVVTPTNGTSKFLSGSFRVGNGITSAGVSEPAAEIFTATGALSANAPWADIQRVTYELKNSPAGSGQRDLYRSVMRNLLSTTTPVVDDQLLLSGVASVKFSCYDGTQWNDVWDTTDPTSATTNLPVAVRVEIQMAGSDKTTEPIQLVVPIDSVARTNMVLAGATGN
jgi:general secretion pathway protein J